MLPKTLEIYHVSEKLPESTWSEYTPNYSKHCLVWDDMSRPSIAYYDRNQNRWYCDEELISFNLVFNIIYWAEIPENVNTEIVYDYELDRYYFKNSYDVDTKEGNSDLYEI